MKLLFYFLLFQNICFSQQLFLKDLKTNEHIPYAILKYKSNDSIIDYDYFNEHGILMSLKKKQFDSLIISSLGFQELKLSNHEVRDTIYLKKKEIHLDEIVVTTSKKTENKILHLGFGNDNSKKSIGFAKGMEVCVYIENPFDIEKKIHSFFFKMASNQNLKSVVRLHLYEVSSDNDKPAEELTINSITKVLDVKKNNLVVFNLKDDNIYLPIKGVFIGLEFLGFINQKGINTTKILFTDTTKEKITFVRNYVTKNKWTKFDFINENMESLNFKNSANVSFGIKIYSGL